MGMGCCKQCRHTNQCSRCSIALFEFSNPRRQHFCGYSFWQGRGATSWASVCSIRLRALPRQPATPGQQAPRSPISCSANSRLHKARCLGAAAASSTALGPPSAASCRCRHRDSGTCCSSWGWKQCGSCRSSVSWSAGWWCWSIRRGRAFQCQWS